jgi:putative FmdB family regulatory protein
MPLYDYRCTECGREVEVMHGIHGSGPERCEACGGAMRKALSPPAIHFKGSGWAKKDAAATARKAKPKAGSASEASKPSDDGKPTGGDAGTTDKAASPRAESQSKAPSSAAGTTE